MLYPIELGVRKKALSAGHRTKPQQVVRRMLPDTAVASGRHT